MLKKLLKNKKFRSEVTRFYKKNEEKIIDITLFGSVVKGKEKPRDIDIMLIFKSSIDHDLSYELRKTLKSLSLKVEITNITYAGLFNPNFIARESFLLEGYSLINKELISKGLGFKSFVLFKYDLSLLNKSKRMSFYYSLYGRNKKQGMLSELKAYKFSESIIMSPVKSIEETKIYLNNWKIKYIEIPVLMPNRLIESQIFKQRKGASLGWQGKRLKV